MNKTSESLNILSRREQFNLGSLLVLSSQKMLPQITSTLLSKFELQIRQSKKGISLRELKLMNILFNQVMGCFHWGDASLPLRTSVETSLNKIRIVQGGWHWQLLHATFCMSRIDMHLPKPATHGGKRCIWCHIYKSISFHVSRLISDERYKRATWTGAKSHTLRMHAISLWRGHFNARSTSEARFLNDALLFVS